MKRETYERPLIEAICVSAEEGFAASTVSGQVEGFDREDWNE